MAKHRKKVERRSLKKYHVITAAALNIPVIGYLSIPTETTAYVQTKHLKPIEHSKNQEQPPRSTKIIIPVPETKPEIKEVEKAKPEVKELKAIEEIKPEIKDIKEETEAVEKIKPEIKEVQEPEVKTVEKVKPEIKEVQTQLAASVRVIDGAKNVLGKPYVWGGESIAEGGFDCSGLIEYAYKKIGFTFPGRTAAAQATAGRIVHKNNMQPGDLLFYNYGDGISHVAMFIGNNQVIEAPMPGTPVRIRTVYTGSLAVVKRVLN